MTDEQVAAAIRALDSGAYLVEVARLVGATRNNLHRALGRRGYVVPTPHARAARIRAQRNAVTVTCPTCGRGRLVESGLAHRPHCNRICRSFWARHVDEAVGMVRSGATWAQVARHYGRSQATTYLRVMHWARRLGVDTTGMARKLRRVKG